jgi:hypothetical protein
LQLLRDLSARPAFFDHFNDCFEVAVGAFQTAGNRGMSLVHEILLSSREDISHPPGRIQKIAWHHERSGVRANRCLEPMFKTTLQP